MNNFKKAISCIVVLMLILTFYGGITASAESLVDTNKDGITDVKDVTYLQQYLAGYFEDENIPDSDSDGKIDVNDVTYIQIYLVNSFKVEASFDKTKLSLKVGDKYSLTLNTNSKNYQIKWESSDNNVVRILSTDSNLAEIKATKTGTATVTAVQKDKTVTCKITVGKSKCIDVSLWQGDIDFEKVKSSGIDSVIIRGGYGEDDNQEDVRFEENYKKAKAAGMKVGVYWYSYALNKYSAKKEAENCLKTIGDKELDLPVFLDCEEASQAVLLNSLTGIVDTFCTDIESKGYQAGIYGSYSMLTYSMDVDELKSKYCMWLSQPNDHNLEDWVDVHQYSWYGTVDGISEYVDLNYIYDLSE